MVDRFENDKSKAHIDKTFSCERSYSAWYVSYYELPGLVWPVYLKGLFMEQGAIYSLCATRYKIDKLKEFFKCEEDVKNCPENRDSVYTLLLNGIGVEYFKRGDYRKAIEYTKKALDIVKANISEPATDKVQLPKFYYYLSFSYDSLRLVAQKNDAIDSCISVEMRLNTGYVYSAMALETNVNDIFLKGDYNRCVERATLGEAFIINFTNFPIA